LGVVVDGWVITKGLGDYGTDYLKRAVVAAFGWGANLSTGTLSTTAMVKKLKRSLWAMKKRALPSF